MAVCRLQLMCAEYPVKKSPLCVAKGHGYEGIHLFDKREGGCIRADTPLHGAVIARQNQKGSNFRAIEMLVFQISERREAVAHVS